MLHMIKLVLTMANRIVVLKDGDIMQVGTPREIYDAPNCIFVAQSMKRTSNEYVECYS